MSSQEHRVEIPPVSAELLHSRLTAEVPRILTLFGMTEGHHHVGDPYSNLKCLYERHDGKTLWERTEGQDHTWDGYFVRSYRCSQYWEGEPNLRTDLAFSLWNGTRGRLVFAVRGTEKPGAEIQGVFLEQALLDSATWNAVEDILTRVWSAQPSK